MSDSPIHHAAPPGSLTFVETEGVEFLVVAMKGGEQTHLHIAPSHAKPSPQEVAARLRRIADKMELEVAR